MKNKMWSLKVLLRYIILQMPVLILLIVIYIVSKNYEVIPSHLLLIFLLLWLAKDIILYPFVWKAYIPRDIKESVSMLGKKGKAFTNIDPNGSVEVRGEIWNARTAKGNYPIRKHDMVRVVEVQGLTLLVEPCRE